MTSVMVHVSVACALLVLAGAQLDLAEAPPDAAAAAAAPLPDLLALLHYSPQRPWSPLLDPDVYMEARANQLPEERFKRAGMSGNGPSLSIINPLDVLRQRLLLEMARRQMRESQKQVAENRKLMKTIGKRGSFLRQPQSPYTDNRL